ncbi:MAG TPA: aminotransferase class V-fold PLP-dependent enzyme [Terriglobia bacterium]|nr:aminotransferase class V-fold PLP-dependent enzyme [Terriglobia bacterium]
MTASATRHGEQDRSLTEKARAHFPALARRHNGYPVAYFDGPGGTQVPRQVVESVADYLYHHNANTHWAYPTSAETDEAIAQSRLALAAAGKIKTVGESLRLEDINGAFERMRAETISGRIVVEM